MNFDKDCLVIIILGLTILVCVPFGHKDISLVAIGALATFLTRKPGCDSNV